MSDEVINAAKENLASFYERWFFEPTYRVLADHLMAFATTGRDPNDVKLIPSMIRQVKPSAVRAAMKRYFIDAPSNVVILPPEPPA
jgi:predicted Zn-dependent peptidase